MSAVNYTPRHRGEPKPEYTHRPKADGSCSLACTCPTPLTRAEVDLLGEIGAF